MMILAQATTQVDTTAIESGISVGAALGIAIAVVCSWERNCSILWAILAGMLSWLYVLYFAITRTGRERR